MVRSMFVAFCLLWATSGATAQLVEEEPVMIDNTGPLGTGDNSAQITGEGGEALGVKVGEITLHRTATGVDVYSGLNKVEMIAEESDGWVGSLTIGSGEIRFRPAGRPELQCAAQDIPGWFGPCKVPEAHN